MIFTDEFIMSLEPRDQKYDVREGLRKGFTITVYPTGERSFTFFYHYAGRKRRMTIGKYPYLSLSGARKIHKQALITLENGVDPAFRRRLAIRDTNCSLSNRHLGEY